MADPSLIDLQAKLELIQKSTDALAKQTQVIDTAAVSYSGLDSIMQKMFGNTYNGLEKMGTMTEKQVNRFNLLTAAAFNLRQQFQNNDWGTGFVEQFKNMDASLDKLKNIANNVFGVALPASVMTSAKAAKGFIMNLAEAADNGLRSQNAFISLSGATGNLDQVFQAAGSNLSKINLLLHQQNETMASSIMATGVSGKKVEEYYTALGQVPGALEKMVSGTATGSSNMTMLTASIKLAHGTGRDFRDIVTDLTTAFKDYGLTGENALKFSARMSNISNNLGLDLKSVQSHLTNAAGAFSKFTGEGEKAAKMSESLAKITNDYVQALKTTGMSGNYALGVVQQMTGALSNMTIAQKSFLSAQTGGPGGLMGGFQLEKMMQTDPAKVLEKVREQMKKQMGSIVTLDDASKSQGAASQLVRQMEILKSGPLGQFVKSDQDAYKMLAGFKAMDKGVPGAKEMAADTLKTSLDRGTSIEEKSYTELSRMRAIMEAASMRAGLGTLGVVQKGFTASSGDSDKKKQNLQDAQRAGAESGAEDVGRYAADVKAGSMHDVRGDAMLKTLKLTKVAVKEMPKSFMNSLSEIGEALFSKDPHEIEAGRQENNQMISHLKDRMKSTSSEDKKKIAAELSFREKLAATLEDPEKIKAASTSVGSYNQPIKTKGSIPGGDAGKEGSLNGTVDVHITGYCLNCKSELDNPQTGAKLAIKKTNKK
jgi:hypothetical protein